MGHKCEKSAAPQHRKKEQTLCTFNGNTFNSIPSLPRDGAAGILASPKTDSAQVVFKHKRRWYTVTEPPHTEDITERIARNREATLTLIHYPFRTH